MADQPEGPSFVRSWVRGADGSFNDVKKERFARELAIGRSVPEAAEVAHIAPETGYVWCKHPELRERKKLLRANPAVAKTYSVSIAMILAELHLNSVGARENGDYKASTEALVHMYKIAKEDKSLLETFDATTAAKQSTDVVAALQAHLSKAKAMGPGKDGQ